MEKRKIPVELSENIPNTLEKFGDFLIGLGGIEKKIGPLSKIMESLGKVDIEEALKKISSEPELTAKFANIMMKVFLLFPKLEDPYKLSADEKIRVGGEIKEITKLMKEL